MRRSTRRLLAALLAVAFALNACGDSSTDAASGPPSIDLTIEEDPKAGHNLFIEVSDFTITPENASTEPVDGEGHLHLYVDGERVMRFYNTALHLDGLEPGEHTVSVEVSQNDHSAYEENGSPVRASKTITVGEPAHSHGHNEAIDFEGENPPAIEISVTKDPKSGWNLSAELENFTITPERASTDSVPGEGHLHLYIDGEKITRLYGTDWHIAELSEGSHQIEVEISHNNHAAYAVDGRPIRGVMSVEVSADEAMSGGGHSHDHGGDHQMTDSSADDIPIADADVTIEVSYTDGEVTSSEDRYEIEVGSIVGLVIESDVADQVHVHGYDRLVDLEPGQSRTATFVADIPGVFEVEIEGSGTLLFQLQVS